MDFRAYYRSPLGTMIATAREDAITGLWFEGQKHCPTFDMDMPDGSGLGVVQTLFSWLDDYFGGEKPDPGKIPFVMVGTEFQMRIWTTLSAIPYGETVTYSEIARLVGKPGAARAVGAAVGRNPLCILIPCHRVLGSGDRLTGYAAGTEKKAYLLKLEKIT